MVPARPLRLVLGCMSSRALTLVSLSCDADEPPRYVILRACLDSGPKNSWRECRVYSERPVTNQAALRQLVAPASGDAIAVGSAAEPGLS